MKLDYTNLNELTTQAAFSNPQLLLNAVKEACPSPEYVNKEGFEYGNIFDETIQAKLLEVAQYALTQPFAAYVEFETKLKTIGMAQMMPQVEDIFAQLSSADEGAGIDEEDEQLLMNLLEEAEKPDAQIKAHVGALYSHISTAIRHLICRMKQPLRLALEQEAQKMEARGKEFQAREAEAALLGQGPAYDPSMERVENILERAFADAALPQHFHRTVADFTFLRCASQIGVFADGPSDVELDIDSDDPTIRAMKLISPKMGDPAP